VHEDLGHIREERASVRPCHTLKLFSVNTLVFDFVPLDFDMSICFRTAG
jgi:hypothetical protein